DLVGDREQVVLDAERGDRLELGAREDLPRRVVRAVEDDRARPRGHGPGETVGVEDEVGRLEGDEDGLGAGDDAAGPVVLVERLEDDHFVPGVQDRQERREHRLGRAAADGHVPLGIDLHAVPLRVFVGDGAAEPRRTPRDRVLMEVAVDRPVCRRDQLGGRRASWRPVLLGSVSVARSRRQEAGARTAWSTRGLPASATGAPRATRLHGTMTSRSMGSTCTPLSLSHLTPRSSAPSSPSSSSAIQPWSAFPSARRMLMTRSKSLTRRYTIGSWISSVGNVSRRRMRGIASTGSTAPGDGGNDRDLIAVLEHRLLRLEEPDVLLVHVDI